MGDWNGDWVVRTLTNLFPQGQAAAGVGSNWVAAGGGSITISVDAATASPFAPRSIKVLTDGGAANQGLSAQTATGLALASGTACAGSCFFLGVAAAPYTCQMIVVNTDASMTNGAATTLVATGRWQLLVPAAVSVAPGKTGNMIVLRVSINGTRAETFWAANAMLSTGSPYAPPYVPTDGATVTRYSSFDSTWRSEWSHAD